MKKFTLLVCLQLVAVLGFSQELEQKQLNYSDLLGLAKTNLANLDKTKGLAAFYRIDYTGIKVDLGKPTEQFFTYSSLPKVVSMLESMDNLQLNKIYEEKNLASYGIPIGLKKYEPIPTNIEGLVVALDPGHFASDFRTAIQEDKYVKMHGSEFGRNSDVKFYEAELNDLTSLLVETKLLALGAKPFRTKPMGTSALGKSFKDWYKDDFKIQLDWAHTNKEVTHKEWEILKKGDSIYAFDKFFKYKDFRKRVDFINQQEPDLTVCIHYNAKEGSRRDENKYLSPVDDNYSMAFVPGAFMAHELNRVSERVDFLRLLLSADLDKSLRLANLILTQQRMTTGIAPVGHNQIKLDDQVCTKSIYEGVYLRNLAMTRLVKGPIVYLEALLQDNKDMAAQLATKDFEFTHPEYGKLKAPKICDQVAQGIVNGILAWIEENKSYAIARATDKDQKMK